jgi:hypothetical protein
MKQTELYGLTNKPHSPRHNFYNLFVKKTNLTDKKFVIFDFIQLSSCPSF